MEGKADWWPVSSNDRNWWTSPDEGYWQALLEQGQTAPQVAPPANSREIFHDLDREPGLNTQGAHPGTSSVESSKTERDWQSAQLALDRGETFYLQVSGANRGGLIVDWNGLQGFIPASHLLDMPRSQDPNERMADLTGRIGDSVSVRMIEVDDRQSRLVFSERAAASNARSPESVLSALQPGDICQGTVTNLTTFGAFVDLGGVEGLIHISELSWDRVRHPSDILHPGQDVQVHVLGVNPDERRIALSLKRLRPDPWFDVAQRYKVGTIVEGTVTNVVSFGAFVRVEEGLEGLIHISELAEGNFLHPRNVVHEGDQVRVRVLRVDAAKHRLGLSLRQAHDANRSG
jgi:small subunit ribosomal protein S1